MDSNINTPLKTRRTVLLPGILLLILLAQVMPGTVLGACGTVCEDFDCNFFPETADPIEPAPLAWIGWPQRREVHPCCTNPVLSPGEWALELGIRPQGATGTDWADAGGSTDDDLYRIKYRTLDSDCQCVTEEAPEGSPHAAGDAVRVKWSWIGSPIDLRHPGIYELKATYYNPPPTNSCPKTKVDYERSIIAEIEVLNDPVLSCDSGPHLDPLTGSIPYTASFCNVIIPVYEDWLPGSVETEDRIGTMYWTKGAKEYKAATSTCGTPANMAISLNVQVGAEGGIELGVAEDLAASVGASLQVSGTYTSDVVCAATDCMYTVLKVDQLYLEAHWSYERTVREYYWCNSCPPVTSEAGCWLDPESEVIEAGEADYTLWTSTFLPRCCRSPYGLGY